MTKPAAVILQLLGVGIIVYFVVEISATALPGPGHLMGLLAGAALVVIGGIAIRQRMRQ